MPRNPLRKPLAAIACAAMAVLTLPGVAPAATSGIQVAGKWTFAFPKDTDRESTISAGSLIMNPAKRRAFQIFPLLSPRRTLIRIIDLDTMKTIAESINDLDGEGVIQQISKGGYHHGLDMDKNVLYLPYASASGNFTGIASISGDTGAVIRKFDRTRANDPTGAVQLGRTPPEGTEDAPGLCTSNFCQPQTFGVLPVLDAIDFTPSYVSGGKDKIIMLWHEQPPPGTGGNVFVTWATQWDAETGKQDFSYRIQACSSALPSGTYPLSIFQSRLGGGIYVGCRTQGATGQVVRIRISNTGVPEGEDSYPGPTGVVDILADKESDRVVFQIGTPAGESYWVFSGQVSNYTGISAATLGSSHTRTGIDPLTGRLYVMAVGTTRGRGESQPDALLTSDLRRAPTPQVVLHPDAFVKDTDLQLVFDTAATPGVSRIFAHPQGKNYFVLIDDSDLPDLNQEVDDPDSRTMDIEEQAGVTDANYAGAGHAYGLRALLAGGVQGAVPLGADANGVTLRLISRDAVGSPCQTGDREFRFGSVVSSTLDNQGSAAESAASSTEAGSISDLREPSGRCHPKPATVGTTPDLPRFMPDDTDGDGLSDGDEILGSDWPFFAAVCSGDADDERVTTLRPLDRDPVPSAGVPVPDTSAVPIARPTSPADETLSNPRNTPVRLEDNRAKVHCSQTTAVTQAAASGGAATIDGLPPSVDSLEVGAVGGSTHIYRSKERGLVTETVSYVRDIKIGNRISIDMAYSKAVSWAGGRPGTAGTSLDRRICGVSIPELGGQYSVIPIDSPAGNLPPDPDPIEHGNVVRELTKDVPNPEGGTGYSPPLVDSVDPYGYDDDNQNFSGAVAPCGDVSNDVPQANTPQLGPRPFLEILNRVLGARGRATIPEPDTALRLGSPGGYLASIQKDRVQQIGARTVSNDGSTEVPALELQFFQDDPNTGRGRQLFQFAGVDASVTYGIYLLNPEFVPIDTPDDNLTPVDITDDLPPWTGGPVMPPVGGPVITPPPSTPPSTGVFAPVTYVYRGVSFLARKWQDAALAGGVLALLVGPLLLLARRRALRTLA